MCSSGPSSGRRGEPDEGESVEQRAVRDADRDPWVGPAEHAVERRLEQIGDLVDVDRLVGCGDEGGRERDELAVERRCAERHLGEEEAERDQQRQQHDDEADRDQRVGVDPVVVVLGRHRRRRRTPRGSDPRRTAGSRRRRCRTGDRWPDTPPAPRRAGSGSWLHRRRNPSTTSSSSTSNPRIGSPSNVSGSPSASRSTGTTTPAAATDPVGIAVIAPPDDDEHSATGSLGAMLAPARTPRPSVQTSAVIANGRTVAQCRSPRSGSSPRQAPPTTAPTIPPMIAGDHRVAHRRRRSRVAEHRSGADAESETDGDDGRRDEGGIAVPTRTRLRTVRLGLGHGGDANGSPARRVGARANRDESHQTEQTFGDNLRGQWPPESERASPMSPRSSSEVPANTT